MSETKFPLLLSQDGETPNWVCSECYQQNKVHDCQTCRPVGDGAPRRTLEKNTGTQSIRRKYEKKNLQLVLNKC